MSVHAQNSAHANFVHAHAQNHARAQIGKPCGRWSNTLVFYKDVVTLMH